MPVPVGAGVEPVRLIVPVPTPNFASKSVSHWFTFPVDMPDAPINVNRRPEVASVRLPRLQ